MLTLQLEITIVNEWLSANKLTLNTSKTTYVIFGKKTQTDQNINYHLIMNGQILERLSQMKYLGVILDEHLNFDQHISVIHNKAVNKLGIIRKSRQFLGQKHLYRYTKVRFYHNYRTAALSTIL